MTEASGRLHVKARLLTEPALWCWEICDQATGRVVESSWASTWTAYSSREEAEAAGRQQLHQLGAGGVPASRPSLPRAS